MASAWQCSYLLQFGDALKQNRPFCFSRGTMREQPYGGGSLFGPYGSRKYLNAAERRRFLESAQQLPPPERLFCQALAWSGGRISEVLALTPASIDTDTRVASLETLKRRKRGIVRQVPLPPKLLAELDAEFGLARAQQNPQLANVRIWQFSRTTAWRRIKEIMAAAGISGTPAMPKGLRHGFPARCGGCAIWTGRRSRCRR
jgi:integrase/recombinase XerD